MASGNSYPGNDSITISAGDTLQVSVYREEDLSGSFEVRDDGTIEFPLIGSVTVVNLTLREASAKISKLLEVDYLVNPSLNITLTSSSSKMVMVLGSVSKPGSYPFPNDSRLTTLGAIALAGGFTRYANPNRTKIIRTLEDGQKATVDADLKNVLNGKAEDKVLHEGDLVMVPESTF